MIRLYPYMLGIVDTLNDWNDKLNKLADKYMNNVGFGTLVFFILVGVAFFAVGTFNKKDR